MDQRLVTLSLANQGQSAISKYYKKKMFNLKPLYIIFNKSIKLNQSIILFQKITQELS